MVRLIFHQVLLTCIAIPFTFSFVIPHFGDRTRFPRRETSMQLMGHSLVGVDVASKCRLVLASQSPRRAEILEMMGLKGQFEAQVSPFDEGSIRDDLKGNVEPTEYTRIMAENKAQACGLSFSNETNDKPTLVLGSDTIVDLDGSILEKPISEEQAKEMLTQMSGRKHFVHTGVAIYSSINSYETPITSFTETAEVHFAELTEQDILNYIASKEPMDKAGSYGIQGIGGQFVKSINGDFFTVMGFPMHRLSWEISQIIQDYEF